MTRVMLVDDQELFRAGIAVIIDAQEDMEVVASVGDGRSAVAAAYEARPDVVLMDLRMPEMDGVEATRLLLQPASVATRPHRLAVLVLTTFDLDARAAEAIRYGASGFLLKDVSPSMLVDAIRTVHVGHAVLSPRDLSTILTATFTPEVAPPAAVATLTDKEREVLGWVSRGLSNIEIGKQMFVSESTVKSHVGALLRKLDARDRVQLVVYAHDHRLLLPPDDGRLTPARASR
ncbi:response regulator [Demequina aestuarii]|uniref:response regulator n=1 Tax=Demequina aestuarii TaxID=327095 RepID=UPI000786006F|nr:response regulator transcription factor [Demequina aestuarii]